MIKSQTQNPNLKLYLRAKLNHLEKIRVAAVSYLNTKPLLYGIKRHPIINEIELIEDYPSMIAQMLIDGEVDVGLIPVAATLRLKNWRVVTDYCIGCDGPVASVCIFTSSGSLSEISSITASLGLLPAAFTILSRPSACLVRISYIPLASASSLA